MTELNKSVLSYALTLLGRRMYSKAQLQQKLRKMGYGEEEVNSVILYCEERGYLNDYDFARFWIEDRLRLKPMGRWRLKGELLQKGIQEEIAGQLLDELLPEERELSLAKELMLRKFRQIGPGQGGYRKIYSFLHRRGFTKEAIDKAADELGISFSGTDPT